MSVLIALILPAALVALWLALVARSLVRARRAKEAAWSALDLPLRRHMEPVPALAALLEHGSGAEMDVPARLRDLHARADTMPPGDLAARLAIEGLLSQALERAFALTEADPGLRGNADFAALRATVEAAALDLQAARRTYNAAARDLNALIESFPANLLAGFFGFAKAPYAEIVQKAVRG